MGRPNKYKYPTFVNGKIHPFYEHWRGMVRRCNESYKIRNRSYDGCSVSDEWKDYNIFFEWCLENYYYIDNELMCLDKDILDKNNKIYGPTKCIFVPSKINQLLESSKKSRGTLPIGVTHTRNNNYISRMSKNGKCINIGVYDTPEEAFYSYKISKEYHIREIANMYMPYIPRKLYIALYNYRIDIND